MSTQTIQNFQVKRGMVVLATVCIVVATALIFGSVAYFSVGNTDGGIATVMGSLAVIAAMVSVIRDEKKESK